MTFPPDVRKQLLKQLASSLEDRTIADLRRLAQIWHWPVKGTAKAAIAQTLVASLTDPSIMQPAFANLPAQEQAALTLLTVVAIGGNTGQIVARILAAATGADIGETEAFNLVSDLVARGLVYFEQNQGYIVPAIFKEWLPAIAPAALHLSGAQRFEAKPALSAAMLSMRVEDLLYSIGADRPTLPSRHHLPKPAEVTPRSGPFNTEMLAHWGYDSSDDKDLARFLLMALVHGRLLEVNIERSTSVLQVNATAQAPWSGLTPAEQRAMLNRFWHAYSAQSTAIGLPYPYRWNEIDLAMEHLRRENSPYRLIQMGYTDAVDYALEALALQLRVFLASIVNLLVQDTWCSFEGLCRLARSLLPDLLFSPNLGNQVQWAEKTQKLNSNTMTEQTWQATHGELVAAWLAGPAAWLGLVEVAYDQKRLVAFRRPGTPVPSQSVLAPRDTLSFLVDGRLTLRTYPQAAELRHLVRQIARLDGRDHRQLTFRLDPVVFRTAFDRGATAAQIIESFARFGFPLPREIRERITAWQSRAGRFRLYEDLAAVEFADDLTLREVQAALDLSKLAAFPASPRCLLVLNPDAVPSMVEDLRRRGYLPKVTS